jgi:hypothetical protein
VLAPEGLLLVTSTKWLTLDGGLPGTEKLALAADLPEPETLTLLHSAGLRHIRVRRFDPLPFMVEIEARR